MSASTSYSKLITVVTQYNATCAMFAMTSAELPGLFLAGKDPAKLLDDVPAVIKAIYRVGYNMQVEVVMDQSGPFVGAGQDFVHVPSTTFAKVEPLAA